MKAMRIICLISFVFVVSCAKPYVGRQVLSHDPRMWCMIGFLPQKCTVNQTHFIFKFTISETGAPDEYRAKGTAKWKETGGALRIDHTKSTIGLILANDRVVTDYKLFSFMSAELGEPVQLDKKFVAQDFDAVGITYELWWVSELENVPPATVHGPTKGLEKSELEKDAATVLDAVLGEGIPAFIEVMLLNAMF